MDDKEYMLNDQKKIILGCGLDLLKELEANGEVRVRAKGYTELPKDTLTCVNLGILNKEELPRFIKKLKTY